MVLWFPLWREENSRGNHIERAIQIFCWIQFLRKSFQRKCNLRVKWTISQSPSWKVVQLVGIWQRERLKFGKAFFCILNAGMHLECSVQITGNTVNKAEGKLWPSYDQVLKPNLEKQNLYASEPTKHSQEKYANLASKNNEMPLSRGIFVHPANKVILLGWTFFACVFVKI